MARNRGTFIGITPTGLGFRPGHGRADKPGASALPSGPEQPIERNDVERTSDGRMRDPRTAANMTAHEDALKPRRWTPGGSANG